MKKIICSFIIVFIAGLIRLYAQCTPDGSLTQPGYYPNCSIGLPHDTVNRAYNTVLQFRVLTDTMVGPFHGTVDSITLTNVKGLPGGFGYETNPPSQTFPGGSNACVLVTGTPPTAGMAGNYPLTIYLTIYGVLAGSNVIVYDSVTCYSITIDPAEVGVNNLAPVKFDLSQNFPNPATRRTDIYYSVPSGMRLEFRMYNLLGKLVYQKSLFAERGTGKITLDTKDFAPGIYMYNLSNGKATLTRRLVMNNN